MYIDAAKLEDEVRTHLIRFGFDLIDFQVGRAAQTTIYRAFIDRLDETPLTLADCEKVTNPLKLYMTSIGAFDDRCVLEVSSPGLDRVLKRERDFARFKGSKIRVRFREEMSKRTVVGSLQDFTESNLLLSGLENGGGESLEIPRAGLIEVRLVSEV